MVAGQAGAVGVVVRLAVAVVPVRVAVAVRTQHQHMVAQDVLARQAKVRLVTPIRAVPQSMVVGQAGVHVLRVVVAARKPVAVLTPRQTRVAQAALARQAALVRVVTVASYQILR